MRTFHWGRVLAVGVIATLIVAVQAKAAPPPITYQGQLKSDGLPVTDTADFRARLWDAQTGGEIVAEFEPVSGVNVVNGLFTIDLLIDTDPAVVFSRRTKYLEILVAVPSGTELVPLSPRQPLTPAPFALYALAAPGGGGTLTLPFAGTNTTDETAIAVTNSGLAPAAAFGTDNANNTQAAVLATTTGSGPGLFAMTGGSGPAVWGLTGDGGGTAGLFRVQGTSATQAALGVENSAMGSAGHFKTTKRENTNSALVVETFSDGSAATFTTDSDPGNVNIAPTVAAENNSFGMAGQFTIQNNESTNDALRASTNGGGNAIHAFTNGSGRAGLFEVDNFGARTVPALEVVSNGRGAGAGFFRTTSVLNTSAALTAEASGNADAIFGVAKGSGTAVFGYNAFGGSGVSGLVEGSTGTAGSFRIDNATNEGVALDVTTNGSGSAARFESTAAEGQAGEFIGNVSVAGFVEANTYKYSTPRSHVLSLAPTDFISNSAAVLVSYMGGAYVYEDRGGLSYLMASILLPHGATITGMTAHVIDESVQNVNVFLMLYTFDGSSTDVVCVVASSGSGGYQSMSSSASHVVNNEDGFYIVFADTSEAWPSSDVKIRGAVITYTTTEAD